jgi:hypothetical protein
MKQIVEGQKQTEDISLESLLIPLNTHYAGRNNFRLEQQKFEMLAENGQLLFSSLEGFSKMKSVIGKLDVAFISAFIGDDRKEDVENTKRLAESLRLVGFGYVRLLGNYETRNKETKEKTYGNDEQTFGVLNNKESSDVLSFFQVIISLGKAYNQKNVLLVPAKEVKFKSEVLQAGHGYWFYTNEARAGHVEDKGVLDQHGVEEWGQSLYDVQDEAPGFSQFTGTDGKMVYKEGDNKPINIWLGEYKINYDFAAASCLRVPNVAQHVDRYRASLLLLIK